MLWCLVASMNHKENDCFVLVLMTHGEEGAVLAYDEKIPVLNLITPFKPLEHGITLLDKPKLFFIHVSISIAFSLISVIRGARRGEGEASHPETEKIVVEKWCYFPELDKMTKVREDGIENG